MSTLFSGHYLRNRSTLDIGVLGYIGIVQHKEHSPQVLFIPPGTPCILVSSVGSFFSYVNDARSDEPEVRVQLAKTGHGPHSSKNFCRSM